MVQFLGIGKGKTFTYEHSAIEQRWKTGFSLIVEYAGKSNWFMRKINKNKSNFLIQFLIPT